MFKIVNITNYCCICYWITKDYYGGSAAAILVRSVMVVMHPPY